jgi:hypothetical protein
LPVLLVLLLGETGESPGLSVGETTSTFWRDERKRRILAVWPAVALPDEGTSGEVAFEFGLFCDEATDSYLDVRFASFLAAEGLTGRRVSRVSIVSAGESFKSTTASLNVLSCSDRGEVGAFVKVALAAVTVLGAVIAFVLATDKAPDSVEDVWGIDSVTEVSGEAV